MPLQYRSAHACHAQVLRNARSAYVHTYMLVHAHVHVRMSMYTYACMFNVHGMCTCAFVNMCAYTSILQRKCADLGNRKYCYCATIAYVHERIFTRDQAHIVRTLRSNSHVSLSTYTHKYMHKQIYSRSGMQIQKIHRLIYI